LNPRLLGAGAVVALASAVHAAGTQTYPIDFFPDLPQSAGLSQLVFVPGFVRPDLVGGTITNTTLRITFTTGVSDGGVPFDAAGLTLLLTAAVPTAPAGFWVVTGADLGWSGQGTFTAAISTPDLNGRVERGVWTFDLSGPVDPDNGPQPYAGSFSDDTRVDITYTPACLADVNDDNAVTVQDIFDFLALYFADDPAADINGQDGVSVQDIFDFLALYFAGCNS
jgi:hypothetical protein